MNKVKWKILFLSLLLLLQGSSSVKAQAAEVLYIRIEQNDSVVIRPQLTGMEDEEIQEIINKEIFEEGGYSAYTAILNSLTDSGSAGLKVKAEAKLMAEREGPGILTILIQASGLIGPGRPGYRSTALMYDLASGVRIQSQDIFKNTQEAVIGLNEAVAMQIEPQMSDYLTPEELYPIPVDNFLLDEVGITFYYDQSKFNTLAGRSGAVSFLYDEIKELLNFEEGSVLNRVRVPQDSPSILVSVESAANEGRLPGLPIAIGENIGEALLNYPTLFDSEAFPTGEKFQLEDARFRGSWVISDGEQITGLLSSRMNLYGLLTGESTEAELIDSLGQPGGIVELDENTAGSYGFSAGKLYSYIYGDHTMHFSFDSQNILQAVWLSL